MTGIDLFKKYTSFRDYSGSEADQYAQLLMTLSVNIGDDLFPLLEKAEESGKKLTIVENDEESIVGEITIDDVVMV